MNFTVRVLDSIFKNVFVRLIFWFLLGAGAAVLFFKLFRDKC